MSKTPRSLSGKVAVVTGGARGIGQALSRALAREGVVVAIGDLDASAAEAAAAELGNGSIGLALDVTDRPAFTAFLDRVEQRLGPIDIPVNNAGIMLVTALDEEDDASISRQLEINVRAVIHGTQEAMRRMKPRGTGHIVNIASLAGRAAAPGLATYVATKHAVIGLSESVRAELRGTGVEITVVMPGFAKTELASGVPDLRMVKRVTPEEIAASTVDALKFPRFDVWAPKRLAAIIWSGAVIPRKWREALSRAMNSNRVVVREGRLRATEREGDRWAKTRPRWPFSIKSARSSWRVADVCYVASAQR
jgi:NAD(P)-dependent dehydrogenase (short-subunit alcohol dehydrogenase family)